MITFERKPQAKINLPINWTLMPIPQDATNPKACPLSKAYTYEEIHGDLAEEISLALESREIKPVQIPSVEPEDFEHIYCWFIS